MTRALAPAVADHGFVGFPTGERVVGCVHHRNPKARAHRIEEITLGGFAPARAVVVQEKGVE